ncbi:hypothetical protein [Bradyrhizobium sp. 188]|uniref:hypothetical protein n=1 Tax=Bradyrhizobium sp. 188 TaxID=2782656 RepID=UPI001FFC0330|nr:hypothetical protein [Bradyrhizobium sp. 188]MCK1496083.1 hypothetical protein [Bradyrhizobium sp. 188]
MTTSVFDKAVDTITLDVLAHLALTGWHRIVFEDETSAPVRNWLGSLDKGHQEKWVEIIREGYLLESREPARYELLVTGVTTRWAECPPKATLQDAARFLSRPFWILLEDAVSDRNFLLKMATSEQREAILQREGAGALAFGHGGGISSMPRTIEAWTREGLHGHLRRWALFDSDALRPSEPSDQSETLRQHCIMADVPHHQLKRRNIENYLPKFALSGWAFGSGDRERRNIFRAFTALSTAQRSHYNMKEGLRGDLARKGKTAGDLFDGLSESDRAALNNGFGRGIGDLFATDAVKEAHLRRDGSWDEMNGVVTELVAILR